MARKKIREYDAKRLLAEKLGFDYNAILVDPQTDLDSLPQISAKMTVKPDQLFGKRKKHGLVLLDADLEQVKKFIKEHLNKEVTIGKTTDKLTHFLIEPYVEHFMEYYVAITSEREKDIIHFSETGGIHVEENWDEVKKIEIPTFKDIDGIDLSNITNGFARDFVKDLYKVFIENNFCYLEINPFTFDENGKITILDTVAQVDSCAVKMDFPKPFGRKIYPEEEFIANIDRNSGASLKLTILNPNGRIWNILSGGGASVIFLDTMTDLGQDDIANYGEYGGNPSTHESYLYAKTILDLMTRSTSENKVLIIGGAIANFTDIEKTFTGIVQALEEYKDFLQNIPIYVRRGGPNYEKGLQLIKDSGERLGIKIEVHGPDAPMVEMIPEALK